MNIAIVCYPTFGGSGVLATELGKSLANKGHSIHFITYQQPVRLIEYQPNIFYHEVSVPPYPLFDYPPYEVALAGRMVDIIINHQIDVLHVHYAIPHASAAYLAQEIIFHKTKKLIPFITTLHGTDITLVGRDKTYEPVVTFSINKSNYITAVSYNLKAETLKHFEIEKEIEVIHNFIDIKRFHGHNCETLKSKIAQNNEKIILHASNFRKIKRIADVIYIFEKIQKTIPAKLLMVGDGPERNDAEILIRDLGLENHVLFLGKQESIEKIYSIADIFLLPSEYESFGLSALEAMAAETVVISSNAGGLSEVNIHGETGFLANVGDIAAMGQFAISVLENEKLLIQMKKQAYQQACKFDIHKIIPKYEALYNKLVLETK